MLTLLYEWRVAVIAAITVPLSLVVAALVLEVRGTTMNIMLMAGLMVAAAALIDDAVVDFDNIRRRLRESAGQSRQAVLVAAVQQVRRPLAFATLIMLAATVPAFYIGSRSGLDGDFFGPVVLSYALALLASWVVVLTVAPLMAALLLSGWVNAPPGVVPENWPPVIPKLKLLMMIAVRSMFLLAACRK